MNRTLALAGALILIGASPPQPVQRSAEAQSKLDKYLDGRVAGEPERCLKGYKAGNPVGIDDHTMLLRDGPRVWRNELTSGYRCDELGINRMLVTVNKNIQLCSGDTTYIVDKNDGTGVGTCVLGNFVPYTKP